MSYSDSLMNQLKQATARLTQARDVLLGKVQDPKSVPWNPDNTSFPLRSELIQIHDEPAGAVWTWGRNDHLGRLNLLTPARIKAASAEIRTGESAPLDLPSHIPLCPGFNRQPFHSEIKAIAPGRAYDDIYHFNTQSGTQWDGFRHIAHQDTGLFYNGVKAPFENTETVSTHHWREHGPGITGRGILLDYRRYAEEHDIQYDTASAHGISLSELRACGHWQGLDIRPVSQGGDVWIGDILLIRAGWTQDYYGRSEEQNKTLAARTGRRNVWAGVEQSEEMITWLHDCYFAAVAADTPAFEVWPTKERYMLHEYLLALWGVPIGEMLDLERTSEIAKREKRYTFFVTSAPFRTVGGVGSWVNGTAIF